ncbi:dihydrofolate reductase family protein, partial [Streptomyces sp. NPDC017248]|uniref:dihydrofolate reductase family protein n=1 Tax=unclassified Streptomyces TaxID=2593676 RepID=UPI0037B0E5E6
NCSYSSRSGPAPAPPVTATCQNRYQPDQALLGLDAGITDAYPHLRHYVFSRTLTKSPDAAVEVISTDPLEKVRELKTQDGKGIWLVGGAELAGALYPEIDELVLKVNPVTIGAGIPLFAGKSETNPRAFTMTGHTALPSGTVFLSYTRA